MVTGLQTSKIYCQLLETVDHTMSLFVSNLITMYSRIIKECERATTNMSLYGFKSGYWVPKYCLIVNAIRLKHHHNIYGESVRGLPFCLRWLGQRSDRCVWNVNAPALYTNTICRGGISLSIRLIESFDAPPLPTQLNITEWTHLADHRVGWVGSFVMPRNRENKAQNPRCSQ